MPLKIKELRNRADDAARNKMMHEQEGIQYNIPPAGQHFQQLLLTVAGNILYIGVYSWFSFPPTLIISFPNLFSKIRNISLFVILPPAPFPMDYVNYGYTLEKI